MENGNSNNESSVVKDELKILRNEINDLKNFKFLNFTEKIAETRHKLERYLSAVSNNYNRAWISQKNVLDKVNVAIDKESFYKELIIGTAINLVWPEGAVGLKELGLAFGNTLVGSIISEFLPEGDLTMSKSEDYGNLKRFSKLHDFERTLNEITARQYFYINIIDEIDAIIEDLESVDSEDVNEGIDNATVMLNSDDLELEWWGQKLDTYNESIVELQTSLDLLPPSHLVIERALWIHWISNLEMGKFDLLDEDEIEDHLHGKELNLLGKNGLFRIDTREVFDTDKEMAVIRKAKSIKNEISESFSLLRNF